MGIMNYIAHRYKRSVPYLLYLAMRPNSTDKFYDYCRDFALEMDKIYPGKSEYSFLNFGFWLENDTVNPGERTYLYAMDKAEIGKEHKILDIGCGQGGQNIICCEKYQPAEIVAVDYNAGNIEYCRKAVRKKNMESRIRYEVADAVNLPESIPQNYYDTVFALHCIYHFDKARFFKEAYDRLKPGGSLIIIDDMIERLPKNRAERRMVTTGEMFYSNPSGAYYMGEHLIKDLEGAGFKNPQVEDISDKVYPGFYNFICKNRDKVEEIRRRLHYPRLARRVLYHELKLATEAIEKKLFKSALIQAKKAL